MSNLNYTVLNPDELEAMVQLANLQGGVALRVVRQGTTEDGFYTTVDAEGEPPFEATITSNGLGDITSIEITEDCE